MWRLVVDGHMWNTVLLEEERIRTFFDVVVNFRDDKLELVNCTHVLFLSHHLVLKLTGHSFIDKIEQILNK